MPYNNGNSNSSTERLADTPSDQFAARARRQREAEEAEQQIADDFGIDESGVGTDLRLDGIRQRLTPAGAQQAEQNLVEQFADEADFVETDDVQAEVDPKQLRGDAFLPSEARGLVAERAVDDVAGDDEFVEPDDLSVEVGRFGIEEFGFRDGADERVASRQFEAQTPLEDIDPDEDLIETSDGFELADDPQREIAAIDFAEETPVDEFDPSSDVRRTSDGFELAEPGQRQVAAVTVADEFDQFDSLDPEDDIRRADDGGFGLAEPRAREVGADELDDRVDEIDIGPGDIDIEFDDDGSFDVGFDGRI